MADLSEEAVEAAYFVEEFLRKVTGWEGSAEDELTEALEEAEKLPDLIKAIRHQRDEELRERLEKVEEERDRFDKQADELADDTLQAERERDDLRRTIDQRIANGVRAMAFAFGEGGIPDHALIAACRVWRGMPNQCVNLGDPLAVNLRNAISAAIDSIFEEGDRG